MATEGNLLEDIGISSVECSAVDAIRCSIKYVRPDLAPEDQRQLQHQMEQLLLEGPR